MEFLSIFPQEIFFEIFLKDDINFNLFYTCLDLYEWFMHNYSIITPIKLCLEQYNKKLSNRFIQARAYVAFNIALIELNRLQRIHMIYWARNRLILNIVTAKKKLEEEHRIRTEKINLARNYNEKTEFSLILPYLLNYLDPSMFKLANVCNLTRNFFLTNRKFFIKYISSNGHFFYNEYHRSIEKCTIQNFSRIKGVGYIIDYDGSFWVHYLAEGWKTYKMRQLLNKIQINTYCNIKCIHEIKIPPFNIVKIAEIYIGSELFYFYHYHSTCKTSYQYHKWQNRLLDIVKKSPAGTLRFTKNVDTICRLDILVKT